MDNTSKRASDGFPGSTGIVFVTTTLSISEARRRSRAGPESTAWVKQA